MIGELAGAIDALAAVDVSVLADSDSVVELFRQLSRLEAVAVRAAGLWDANREWAPAGAKSGAQWLATETRLPKQACHRRLRLGRELRTLPVAEAAWLCGAIDGAHVSALAAERNDVTAEAMARDEALLVSQASHLRYATWHRSLTYWRQLADPDGVEVDAERLYADRQANVAQTFGGAWHGDFLLDPIGGTVFSNEWRRIEDELFQLDWTTAKERLGRDPALAELDRTPAQRRADALVEMGVRARTAPRNGKRPAPLFSVLVGYETFAGRICELADQTPVRPGSLLPWLDDAYIERVVFDGPSRVIDVGVTRRFFTGATKTAVSRRDRECYHPMCDVPAEGCETDHIEPSAAGGITRQDNGRLACGFHNRHRNRPPP
ncbi:MAG: hypothetical protein JWO77_2217 [Ilumatobacteraceae bacterium]|nr:hypothetical protein [Ilumatobacteraceae bacterium]